ncbi:endonuclease III domain-containing protein [Candidatus Woesearchaeota archaeon]|nr:endonuclease III domain-containing protein [Candidatus Woesearchaeota archaeon]
MNKIFSVYNKLYFHFGPQHWWPVTEKGNFHPTYSGGPKNEKQQLEVCFGSILAQNTSWKNAEKVIVELNKHSLFDVKKIIKIGAKKLAQIIRSSGYHNQKAKKLKNFCDFLLNKYDGKLNLLFKNDIAELRKQLLSVNGIGPETADSIILYAAKKPIFVIDAYAKRIANRLGYKEQRYDELQNLFMENLPNSEKLFNEYHALLVELGKDICKKKPLCGKCPINRYCSYYKSK